MVFGGDFLGSVIFAGTNGADTLTGTAAAETFVGGQGDDILTGGGGADAFQGGEGNDTIVVSDLSFRHADGGGGTDTLRFLFAGAINLGDLDGNAATSERSKIAGIEVVDMANGVANTMTLGVDELLSFNVDTINAHGVAALDNVLAIEGDASDTLSLTASEWSAVVDIGTLPG